MHARTPILLTLTAAGLLATQSNRGQAATAAPIASSRVTWAAAPATKDAWGELRAHFEGETYGLRDALVATAVLKPGQQIHPPHQHAEEEVVIVTEGSGEWHLDGKDFPAAKGDALYAAPWIFHGIKNTGRTPLTWVVMKWNTKGVAAQPAPATK